MNQEELTRLFHRIQEARNHELPSVLSSILPKVLPLTNQEGIRSDGIKLITEALRRAKLANTELKLEVFLDSLHVRNAPFGCNFAIAFMDALIELNCITDADVSAVGKLLENLISFERFTYQSNSLCYYLLQNCSLVFEALATYSQEEQQKMIELLYDYFLDVLMLKASDLGKPSVPLGLSENRQTRILLKKKNLDPALLLKWKTYILTAMSTQAIESTSISELYHWNYVAALIACQDENTDIQAFGKKILNLQKDKLMVIFSSNFKEYSQLCHRITESLLVFAFPAGQADSNKVVKDRTSLPKELQFQFLDFLFKNFEWLFISAQSFTKLFEVFLGMISSSVGKYASSSEISDRILKVVFELFHNVLQKFLLPPNSSSSSSTSITTNFSKLPLDFVSYEQFSRQISMILPVIFVQIKNTLSHYAYNNNHNHHQQSQHNSTVIFDLKNSCYNILSFLLAEFPNGFSLFFEQMDLFILLFTIAATDHSVGATTLFKLLEEILEKWDPHSKFFSFFAN
jgi:hypothetical protein